MRAKPQSETVLFHVLNKNDGKKGLLSKPIKRSGKKNTQKKFFASFRETNVLRTKVGQARLNNRSKLRLWKPNSFHLIRS